MLPVEYERVKAEPDYAVRRIEALTSALKLVEQGYEFTPPAFDDPSRRRLSRRLMRKRAGEALDPDYLSWDG
jgi:hypothetical protein